MSDQVKVLLPKLGESIHSATVVRWFKNKGESVRLDEPLLEVSTDKVNSEIPSPCAGVLLEQCAHVDQELPVGALVAIISSSATALQPSVEPAVVASCAKENSEEMKGFYSPAFLRILRESGVSLEEAGKIPGSGMGGRVTKSDLEEYIATKKAKCPLAKTPSVAKAPSEDIERLKMSGMRKAIADNMVRSFYEAPHATLVTEVDVTAILKRIQKEKEAFLAQHGAKLTITAFIAKALTEALKEYPLLNASLEQDTILVKKFINIGIAVSVDQGLFVPVIKQAQTLSLPQIASAIGDLSARARAHKLLPDDVKDGTVTITNFGMSGVQIGVPIIRYPEVAIIGVGAVSKRVVPLDDETWGVRSLAHISLTFDHRVLDGMYGCGFLNALKKHIETSAIS